MTLDFVRLAPRIDELVRVLQREEDTRGERIDCAGKLLESLSASDLADAVRIARNAIWMTAVSEERPGARHAPPGDSPYAALATDGSSIDVSRHAAASCYVINIGHAWMDYPSARVDLGSEPELEFAADRLLRGDTVNASKESVMTGNLLDAYRTAREMLRLADIAESACGEAPIVALLDGQFVLWGLKESELSSEARDLIFDSGVLSALDRLRDLADRGRLALGSFISRPGAREVTNSLRLAACPRFGGPDCKDCPRKDNGARPCDDVAGGVDGHLFARFLDDGERSAIFRRSSTGSDLTHADDRYEDKGHGLRFFYLKVPGGEIARIEIPQWIADRDERLALLHGAIIDQCRRGGGYPLVLQEAHEQAVIDGQARSAFNLLLERQLELRDASRTASGKAWSKRRRPI
jgi:NurA domain